LGAVYCQIQKNQSVAGIGFILLLSVLNRYFEILKWQNLASYLKPISVSEATKQVLAALTAGILLQMALANTPEKHCIMKNLKPQKSCS
jgi:hypothetical protein